MNDKQLADRIIALGVGEYRGDGRYLVAPATDQVREHGSAKWFVRDSRVAMALIEKCHTIDIEWHGADYEVLAGSRTRVFQVIDKSLPRAICEACVEALENES